MTLFLVNKRYKESFLFFCPRLPQCTGYVLWPLMIRDLSCYFRKSPGEIYEKMTIIMGINPDEHGYPPGLTVVNLWEQRGIKGRKTTNVPSRILLGFLQPARHTRKRGPELIEHLSSYKSAGRR